MSENNNENVNPIVNSSEEEHTKEFKLNNEDIEQTKEFKIKKEDIGASAQPESESDNSLTGDVEPKFEKDEVESENQPKKILSSFKSLPKSAKIAIIVAAASVVVLLAVVIIVIILKSNNIENNSIIVYTKGNECVIRIDDKELKLSNSNADNFKADKASKRVFYTVVSSYDSNYYDLYYVQLQKNEITKPSMIDCVIEPEYEVAGNKVYYLKYNETNKANDGYVSDLDSRKNTVFSSNVNSIYHLSDDSVYFTKPDGENLALYSFSGDAPKTISEDIVNLRSYPDAKRPHIIYETNSGSYNSLSSLYIAYEGSEPELICDNAYMVAFDEYKADGNLYYYTTSQETVSWSYVISDELAESDKQITKPNRFEYLGGIFGISEEYNRAYLAYVEKTVRDEIRQALDETVARGGMNAPVFSAFAYNGEKVVKIAQDIDPSRVYSYAPYGDPKIVFEQTDIKEGETDIATLAEIAARSGIEEVILYACDVVAKSVKSLGMAVAVSKGDGCMTYELNEYDKSKTRFRFSDNGEMLFAVVSDSQGDKYTLYANDLQTEPSPRAAIAANVKSDSVKINGNSIVYLITDTGKDTGDIFSYDGKDSVKISNAASEFIVDKTGNVFVLKNHTADTDEIKADYYVQFDGKEIEIGKNIFVSSFKSREDGSAAFIEDDGDETKLMIYFNGETTEVCDDVSELLLYN